MFDRLEKLEKKCERLSKNNRRLKQELKLKQTLRLLQEENDSLKKQVYESRINL